MFKNWLKTTILLYVLWFILSGRTESKFLMLGLISSMVIASLCQPMLYIENRLENRKHFILDLHYVKFIGYWIWLLGEIVKSSLSVCRLIIKKKIEIDPQVIQFQCHFKNPIATTLFVNSIILTPSTVTVNVDPNNVFTVHALTVEAAEDLLGGEMQRRIAKVFDEFNS
ncbi:putative monovalent cation/H+ antiporter subunit E [uncultured Eubacterium sp.]|nr:putative monovalent cation/H+ antiporter subunit E [uncultured Eubacterium sp.]